MTQESESSEIAQVVNSSGVQLPAPPRRTHLPAGSPSGRSPEDSSNSGSVEPSEVCPDLESLSESKRRFLALAGLAVKAGSTAHPEDCKRGTGASLGNRFRDVAVRSNQTGHADAASGGTAADAVGGDETAVGDPAAENQLKTYTFGTCCDEPVESAVPIWRTPENDNILAEGDDRASDCCSAPVWVLVVDDDRLSGRALARIVRRVTGFEIRTARNIDRKSVV